MGKMSRGGDSEEPKKFYMYLLHCKSFMHGLHILMNATSKAFIQYSLLL